MYDTYKKFTFEGFKINDYNISLKRLVIDNPKLSSGLYNFNADKIVLDGLVFIENNNSISIKD